MPASLRAERRGSAKWCRLTGGWGGRRRSPSGRACAPSRGVRARPRVVSFMVASGSRQGGVRGGAAPTGRPSWLGRPPGDAGAGFVTRSSVRVGHRFLGCGCQRTLGSLKRPGQEQTPVGGQAPATGQPVGGGGRADARQPVATAAYSRQL